MAKTEYGKVNINQTQTTYSLGTITRVGNALIVPRKYRGRVLRWRGSIMSREPLDSDHQIYIFLVPQPTAPASAAALAECKWLAVSGFRQGILDSGTPTNIRTSQWQQNDFDFDFTRFSATPHGLFEGYELFHNRSTITSTGQGWCIIIYAVNADTALDVRCTIDYELDWLGTDIKSAELSSEDLVEEEFFVLQMSQKV